jgi:putative colanic acid biosynthesis acetyltransferase WcaF
MNTGFNPEAFTRPAFRLADRARRAFWNLAYALLFRPSPRPCHAWRRFILRCFGAGLGQGCHVYPKAVIWAPWNLRMGEGAAIADGAEVYNPAPVDIGEYAVISQGAYLCGASHDYRLWHFPLIASPITVGKHAWVAARVIVQMGVRIGDGSVIGAGSVVTRDMPAWSVCAGNPCRVIKSYRKDDAAQTQTISPPETSAPRRRESAFNTKAL